MPLAIVWTRAICLVLTRSVAGTALAIASALPDTLGQSRRDKPDLDAAVVLADEATEIMEEVMTVARMVFPLLEETFRCDQYRCPHSDFPIALGVNRHYENE